MAGEGRSQRSQVDLRSEKELDQSHLPLDPDGASLFEGCVYVWLWYSITFAVLNLRRKQGKFQLFLTMEDNADTK